MTQDAEQIREFFWQHDEIKHRYIILYRLVGHPDEEAYCVRTGNGGVEEHWSETERDKRIRQLTSWIPRLNEDARNSPWGLQI